jgi:hypothetical protein
VILHEIFFDSLGGDGDNPPTGLTEPPAGLPQALERDFGSVTAWRAEFTAMAKAKFSRRVLILQLHCRSIARCYRKIIEIHVAVGLRPQADATRDRLR